MTSGGGSAFSPASIAGLQLWLDASKITGLNDGDAVGTWRDISGNGYDFSQSTGTKQPTYQTAELNSLPVVRFDGVDDILTRANFLASANSTTFAVAKRTGGAVTQEVCVLGNNGGALGYVVLGARALGSANWGAFYTPWTPSSYSCDGTWLTMATDVSTFSNFNLRTNSNAPEAKTGAGYAALTYSAVGGDEYAQYLTGDIAEIIHYDTVLSDSDITRVTNYLRSKYAHY
jgi:hypothetical protein